MKPNTLFSLALFVLVSIYMPATAEITTLEVPLWDQTPPGSEGISEPGSVTTHGKPPRSDRWVRGVINPKLTVYRPDPSRATGAAAVVFPGGGYAFLSIDKEGHYVAHWLAERGLVGVVVPYRCGREEYQHPVPMHDAQRSIQFVRSRAEEWNIDPDQIGVVGFSAGGHLAATAATQWIGAQKSADPVLGVSSRPDFAVLVYPVISFSSEIKQGRSVNNLLGNNPEAHLVKNLSADEQVSKQTPPTLLIHSADDRAVPVENSIRYLQACRKHEVPCELHVYESGNHGYGMWRDNETISQWPQALETWLIERELAKAP